MRQTLFEIKASSRCSKKQHGSSVHAETNSTPSRSFIQRSTAQKLSLYLIRWIQMPIPDDLSVPVFSYVGRLKDSRKGLELFLDALDHLWKSQFIQSFKAWVIGGSEEDKAWALRLATCRPILREKLSS